MTKFKPAYLHFRSFDGEFPGVLGGATVAIHPITDEKIVLAIAYCNPKDNYNKNVGRMIADGRVRSHLNGDTTKGSTRCKIIEVDRPLDSDLSVSRVAEAEVLQSMAELGYARFPAAKG